jgi:hypothetical protein
MDDDNKQRYPYRSPTHHFMEGGASVFVRWEPTAEGGVHQIGALSSGDFEVLCRHSVFDADLIRAQVSAVQEQRKTAKKND